MNRPRPVDPSDAAAVYRWREQQRILLLRRRLAVRGTRRKRRDEAIAGHLLGHFEGMRPCSVAGYWPIRGEPDLSSLWRQLGRMGVELALPAVVVRGEAVRFRRWTGRLVLVPDATRIPAPPPLAEELVPEVVIAPVVGFDADGYRLGNGGGYYDRTLATLRDTLPLGVGYEELALPTIHPLDHDIPMQAIITECGVVTAMTRSVGVDSACKRDR